MHGPSCLNDRKEGAAKRRDAQSTYKSNWRHLGAVSLGFVSPIASVTRREMEALRKQSPDDTDPFIRALPLAKSGMS